MISWVIASILLSKAGKELDILPAWIQLRSTTPATSLA